MLKSQRTLLVAMEELNNKWKELINLCFKLLPETSSFWSYYTAPYFAGGCIASALLGEEINDFDTYFIKQKDAISLKNQLTITNKDLIITQSKAALLLSNKIQIIYLLGGRPEEIIPTFDFIHTCNWYNPEYPISGLNLDALKAILNKQLIYNGSNYPLIALKRVGKFISRGWTIENYEIEKIISDIERKYLLDYESRQDNIQDKIIYNNRFSYITNNIPVLATVDSNPKVTSFSTPSDITKALQTSTKLPLEEICIDTLHRPHLVDLIKTSILEVRKGDYTTISTIKGIY